MEIPLTFKAAHAPVTARQYHCRVRVLAAVLVFVAGVSLGTGPAHAAPKQAAGDLTEGFLYFRDKSGMSLRAVAKFFSRDLDAHELGVALVEAVMAGPAAKDLVPVFPKGAAVGALFITSDGDAYVDLVFDGEQMPRADTLTEVLGIYSLVNSLTLTIPEIRRVKFLKNGVENATLGGHVSLAPFFKTNMLIVK